MVGDGERGFATSGTDTMDDTELRSRGTGADVFNGDGDRAEVEGGGDRGSAGGGDWAAASGGD